MSSKVVQAIYDDDDVLLDAVKACRRENYYVEEVFTPFPIHGLDKAMGVPHTRLAITSFCYGLVGLTFAIWMSNYMMIDDWPQDIGGKPSFSFWYNLPSFVPIMFELTVFCAAHLMVITFFVRSRLWPLKEAENPDPRTTDDKFLMEVSVKVNQQVLIDFLRKTGAKEIKVTQNDN